MCPEGPESFRVSPAPLVRSDRGYGEISHRLLLQRFAMLLTHITSWTHDHYSEDLREY
jgi:hypothetical protein